MPEQVREHEAGEARQQERAAGARAGSEVVDGEQHHEGARREPGRERGAHDEEVAEHRVAPQHLPALAEQRERASGAPASGHLRLLDRTEQRVSGRHERGGEPEEDRVPESLVRELEGLPHGKGGPRAQEPAPEEALGEIGAQPARGHGAADHLHECHASESG